MSCVLLLQTRTSTWHQWSRNAPWPSSTWARALCTPRAPSILQDLKPCTSVLLGSFSWQSDGPKTYPPLPIFPSETRSAGHELESFVSTCSLPFPTGKTSTKSTSTKIRFSSVTAIVVVVVVFVLCVCVSFFPVKSDLALLLPSFPHFFFLSSVYVIRHAKKVPLQMLWAFADVPDAVLWVIFHYRNKLLKRFSV